MATARSESCYRDKAPRKRFRAMAGEFVAQCSRRKQKDQSHALAELQPVVAGGPVDPVWSAVGQNSDAASSNSSPA